MAPAFGEKTTKKYSLRKRGVEKGVFKMDEKYLENGLQKIAAEKIPADQNIWQKVQNRLLVPQTNHSREMSLPRWAVIALILGALVLVTALVPPVRAGFIDLVEQIGGVNFTFTADYPGSGEKVTTIPSETIPIEDIISEYPFNFPTWAPSGYSLEPNAQVTWFDPAGERPAMVLTWRSADEKFITLDIHPGTNLIVGLTEIEVLSAQGQQLALWQGGWNYDTQIWDENIPVQTISWAIDGLNYNLQADQSIAVEELVKMVESSFQ